MCKNEQTHTFCKQVTKRTSTYLHDDRPRLCEDEVDVLGAVRHDEEILRRNRAHLQACNLLREIERGYNDDCNAGSPSERRRTDLEQHRR